MGLCCDQGQRPKLGKIGPARITEHPNTEYWANIFEERLSMAWYRMADSNSRLYYYAVNGLPDGLSTTDKIMARWFNGGWFPSTVA